MPPADEDAHARRLGEYIRLQRQMADLSLRGMAELTKVSNAYLSQVERGLHQPSLRVLHAIAEALGIPAEDLLAEAGLGGAKSGRAADRAAGPAAGPASSTEEVIRGDPALSAEEREALLRIYRSFVDRRSSGA